MHCDISIRCSANVRKFNDFHWFLQGLQKETGFSLHHYTYRLVGILLWQKCGGVFSWRYYPWTGWSTHNDNGQLRSVTYKKLRNDTILRVTFHSAFAQRYHDKCSEYYIQFGGSECTQPAPIASTLLIQNYGGASLWQSVPAEVGGFCNATAEGQLLPGDIQVSVHVKQSCSGGDTFTGNINRGRVTNYILIEEYCLWELSSNKLQLALQLIVIYSSTTTLVHFLL